MEGGQDVGESIYQALTPNSCPQNFGARIRDQLVGQVSIPAPTGGG